MRLAPELIDRIREATDIVAVVSEHVQLKRGGRAWKALCPFHKEKTPSFTVNPDRQIFKCFGCGEGGDVFTFLMLFEKLSFPEAVELLAGRAGIPIPRGEWSGSPEDSVYPALEWASSFFRRELDGRTGGPARRYLETRGLDQATTERFRLGWAPPGWTNLLDAAGKRYPQKLLFRGGLVVQNDRGGYYDRFRGRLIIPIRSALGRTIGFGARTLGGEEPKYLNSPETEVFHKGRVLFGLAENRDALKETARALVVEGYMDALALVQAGLSEVVASCGTAFTEEQARIVRRYVERVVLLFDGDQAGVRAAWKSAGLFLGAGLEVQVVTLPEGKDPDSFVREKGPAELRELCEEAPGVVGFAQRTLLGRLEKREDLVKAFAYMGARIDDAIRRRVLLQQAAERFRFDEETLVREADRLRSRSPIPRPAPGAGKGGGEDRLGRLYLARLLSGEVEPGGEIIPEDALPEPQVRKLYQQWLTLREAGVKNPGGRLLEDEAWRVLVSEILALDEESAPLDEVESRLRQRVRSERGKELWKAIQEAETRGDRDQAESLLRELQSLKGAEQ